MKRKPWDCTYFSNRDDANDECAEFRNKHDLRHLMAGYEEVAETLIKAGGHAITLDDLWRIRRRDELPQQLQDIRDMLGFFSNVRKFVRGNVMAEWAALHMAFAMNAASRAQIRPVEPFVEIGISRSNKQKETRARRRTWNGLTSAEREARDRNIFNHFKRTHLSRSGFAKTHAKKYGLKPRRIQEILTRAVGTLPG